MGENMFKKEDISDSYYAHGFLKKEDLGDPEQIVKKDHVEMLGLSVGFDLSGTFPLWEIGEGVRRAFGYTSGFLPEINPLDTEATFSHDVLSWAEFRHVKGTRLYTIAATDASLSVMFHHTILPAMECSCGAGGDTGRVLAVKTGGGDGTEM